MARTWRSNHIFGYGVRDKPEQITWGLIKTWGAPAFGDLMVSAIRDDPENLIIAREGKDGIDSHLSRNEVVVLYNLLSYWLRIGSLPSAIFEFDLEDPADRTQRT